MGPGKESVKDWGKTKKKKKKKTEARDEVTSEEDGRNRRAEEARVTEASRGGDKE